VLPGNYYLPHLETESQYPLKKMSISTYSLPWSFGFAKFLGRGEKRGQ
jgi:hypothetical protein